MKNTVKNTERYSLNEIDHKITAHRRLIRMCGPLSATRMLALSGSTANPDHVLAQYLDSGQSGIPVREVIQICKKYGLHGKAIVSRHHSINSLPVPCILLVHDDQHCIVLEAIDPRRGTARVWDPSVLKSKQVGLNGLNQIWSDKAIVFGLPPRVWRMMDGLNLVCALISLGLLFVRVRRNQIRRRELQQQGQTPIDG